MPTFSDFSPSILHGLPLPLPLARYARPQLEKSLASSASAPPAAATAATGIQAVDQVRLSQVGRAGEAEITHGVDREMQVAELRQQLERDGQERTQVCVMLGRRFCRQFSFAH